MALIVVVLWLTRVDGGGGIGHAGGAPWIVADAIATLEVFMRGTLAAICTISGEESLSPWFGEMRIKSDMVAPVVVVVVVVGQHVHTTIRN